MRGKDHGWIKQGNIGGITPAYAGKSGFACRVCPAFKDHPRVCGEKRPYPHVVGPEVGSPPRMRGKDHLINDIGHVGGITPAYAGKRGRNPPRNVEVRDHPRVCGEKSTFHSRQGSEEGSPPRMRGKGLRGAGVDQNGGITPAYAGKSPGR